METRDTRDAWAQAYGWAYARIGAGARDPWGDGADDPPGPKFLSRYPARAHAAAIPLALPIPPPINGNQCYPIDMPGLTTIHVIPLNDLRPHDTQSPCWCNPRHETQWNDSLVIIHNSADGRELPSDRPN